MTLGFGKIRTLPLYLVMGMPFAKEKIKKLHQCGFMQF